jgi:hypothetical protein
MLVGGGSGVRGACIVGALWCGSAAARRARTRRLASTAARQDDSVQALAARLDAWARARFQLARVDAARMSGGLDADAWADWANALEQLRFAAPQPDGHAALAALCETARAWERHV